MKIVDAHFVISSTKLSATPKEGYPEYAFIGRSNVGKSSLINMLTNHGKLAKTSVKPGKTKCINFFLINKSWYLVDLPGIGYAKRSKSDRELWHSFTTEYLAKRKTLLNTFYLVDIRIPPQQIDIEYTTWLGTHKIPFNIVFTKSDKLNNHELKEAIRKYTERLAQIWEPLPEIIVSSSKNKAGREEILLQIKKTNNLIKDHKNDN